MVNLAAYLHRIDPFVVRFPEGFPIEGVRWYGVSYVLGFIIAFFLIRHIARTGRSTVAVEKVSDLIVVLAIGIVVGGRLGFAAFYQPSLFISFSGSFPWWDLLAMHQGGMASHGGMIGGIIASLYYARRHHHSWPHLLDLFAFAAPLGLFFGRIANFINGELYGRPTSPDNPLAVKFPLELRELPDEMVHPVIVRAEQLSVMQEYSGARPREALTDLVMRGQADVIAMVEPILTPRHPSQIYQALLEGMLLFVLLIAFWWRPRKPGLVAGAAALGYGIMRIIGEFFREPDAHIGLGLLGLSRGQWLSFGLVALGVILLATMSRRDVQPMGGLNAARTSA